METTPVIIRTRRLLKHLDDSDIDILDILCSGLCIFSNTNKIGIDSSSQEAGLIQVFHETRQTFPLALQNPSSSHARFML